MKKKIELLALACLIVVASCSVQPYNPQNYLTGTAKDSLTVEMVTFLGRRPYGVAREDRHNPAHIPHFKQLATGFRLVYYYPANDGRIYYYMLRPARTHQGAVLRGVGGWFIADELNNITSFKEVFNTPVLQEEELKAIGLKLFESMVETGNIDSFLDNPAYIEWPDNRTRYDQEINEWVFIGD